MTEEYDPLDKPFDFSRAIPVGVRRRIKAGKMEPATDIALLRKFLGMSQPEFAGALSIPVSTLRNWEQGQRTPEGPALALLQIAAQHPGIIKARASKTNAA